MPWKRLQKMVKDFPTVKLANDKDIYLKIAPQARGGGVQYSQDSSRTILSTRQ